MPNREPSTYILVKVGHWIVESSRTKWLTVFQSKLGWFQRRFLNNPLFKLLIYVGRVTGKMYEVSLDIAGNGDTVLWKLNWSHNYDPRLSDRWHPCTLSRQSSIRWLWTLACYKSIESRILPISMAFIKVRSNLTAAVASFRASWKFPD